MVVPIGELRRESTNVVDSLGGRLSGDLPEAETDERHLVARGELDGRHDGRRFERVYG